MISTFQEVAITCCLNDPVASASVWDVQTGTNLTTYRGEPVAAGGLSVLAGDYVVAALQDKPFLRVWPVNSQQPLSTLRLVCPGRVTHAQASSDGCYIAVTVAEKVHVYQVASGCLAGTGVRHYQPIRVIQWTPDGSTVVCGGEDGLVTVWSLEALVASKNTPEPRKVLSDHSLPVTDLKITTGSRPRLLTVSMDRTCKVYDLCEGCLLVSLVFDQPLTAVASAALDSEVFVGTNNGTVWQVGLLSPPRHLEYHVTAEDRTRQYTGHSKAVQCLSTAAGGDLLMSGSADGSVIIWHIASCQCLRTFTLKGPVTNAFFAPKPKQLFDNELKPSVFFNSFQTANSEARLSVEVINNETLSLCDTSSQKRFTTHAVDSSEERVQSLKMDINLLKSINSNLYKFSIDKVISQNYIMPRLPESTNQSVTKSKKKLKIQNRLVSKRLKKVKELNQALHESKTMKQTVSNLHTQIDKTINFTPNIISNSNSNVPVVSNKYTNKSIQNKHSQQGIQQEKPFNQILSRGKKKEQKQSKELPQLNKTFKRMAQELMNSNNSYVSPVVNGGISTNKKKKRKRNKHKQET